MKARICAICINSDMLCMACKRKLDEGKISESDVRIARAVHALSKSFRTLEDVTVSRVIEAGDVAVLVCGKGDRARMIGREGLIINRLSRAAGKTLRVVEETDDVKEFVRGLIHPVPLIGLNVIYAPEGEVLRIIIPKGRDMPMPKASLDEVIGIVFGKKTIISNE